MKWRYSQHLYHSLGELWLAKGDAAQALEFADECLKLAERFCQVVEAETLLRQAGASPRSSPPFRRPAVSPGFPPNSRIAAAALCGTPARTAEAVWGESGGPWGHTPTESAGHARRLCTPAGDAPGDASVDGSSHTGS